MIEVDSVEEEEHQEVVEEHHEAEELQEEEVVLSQVSEVVQKSSLYVCQMSLINY